MKTTLFITSAAVGLLFFTPSLLNPEQAAVYKVCNESRQVINHDLEQKCGKLQDATHTEFLCDGLEASSHCWVEQK
jgi:hypothetical protein